MKSKGPMQLKTTCYTVALQHSCVNNQFQLEVKKTLSACLKPSKIKKDTKTGTVYYVGEDTPHATIGSNRIRRVRSVTG